MVRKHQEWVKASSPSGRVPTALQAPITHKNWAWRKKHPPASSMPEMMQGVNPSCCQQVTPGAITWPYVFFSRLFTVEETRKIRNTTFHDVLAAVTYADPTDLQAHVFVWSKGECFVQQQGAGSDQHQQVREESSPVLVTVTQGKHRAGIFSSRTLAVPLSQQNTCKMQGLLISKAGSTPHGGHTPY